MTNPTDPRVEAAARVIQSAMDGSNTAFFEYVAADALKAADKAAWQPIDGVKDCPLAVLIEQGSDEGPYIGSCRDGVWCDGLDMVEPTHYMPLPELPTP